MYTYKIWNRMEATNNIEQSKQSLDSSQTIGRSESVRTDHTGNDYQTLGRPDGFWGVRTDVKIAKLKLLPESSKLITKNTTQRPVLGKQFFYLTYT